jgi:hypothetical protein
MKTLLHKYRLCKLKLNINITPECLTETNVVFDEQIIFLTYEVDVFEIYFHVEF